MRRIVVTEFVSLDGVRESAETTMLLLAQARTLDSGTLILANQPAD